MLKKLFLIIIIIVISGVSGIGADRYIFPYLATTKFFSRYKFLKKASENTTVINKTQQIYVKEDSSVSKITNPVVSSVVNILSYPSSSKSNLSRYASAKNPFSFKNGTGEIITSDGLIITYATAINTKNSLYKVMTSEGNIYDGKLLGIDSWSNLAFIKIEATNLPVVSFEEADNYKLGEKMIAIKNNSIQYQNRFSAGILNGFDPTFNISGKTLNSSEKLEGVLLIDSDIKTLSAGELVINYSGEMVGIVGSVKINAQEKFFIIPSDKIKKSLGKAIDKTLKTNPLLGVYYKPLSKSYALANNVDIDCGDMIYASSGQQGLAVMAGTPASKSNLKINDIIEKVDDKKVSLKNSLSDILYDYKKGDLITLTILRNKQEMKIKVQL